ncbi:RidA family protein [Sphingomonas sp.]|uniref:RidA family protein n=1 Tax=Sphingomonas sp. TaxID=28214 RepID=UPI003B3B675C
MKKVLGRSALLLLSMLPVVKARAHTTPSGPTFIAGPAGRPFSNAVLVDNILYMSGQIGTDGQGKLVDGFGPQVRQAMDNIMAVNRDAGGTAQDIFKCTVMLANMQNWGKFNEIYTGYFDPAHLPARSAFGASGLALNAEVEVECWSRPSNHRK